MLHVRGMAMALKTKLSYHKRLFLILLVFSWVTVLCFIGFQYRREKQYKSDFINAQLQLYNRHLLEAIEDGQSYEDYIKTKEKPFENLRISIITFNGAVVYDNVISSKKMTNHSHRPEIIEALREGEGYNIDRLSESDGKDYFYSATKGQRVIVRSALLYSSTLKELLKADWNFVFLMIVVGLLMSIFIYFVTKRLGKNIQRLNSFATKAEKGESLEAIKPFPNDELGAISNHIVRLYLQWQQTIKDRDEAYQTALKKEQEKTLIKRQLTNNINHELKTPVASMQVCLETLLSGISLTKEKQQELIEMCYSNNERLRHLLSDVSLITRMEDGSQLISKEKVNINKIIEEIGGELEIMTEKERFVLHTNFTEDVCVEGNTSLIASIFRNLTENAIAYSGGKNIFITLMESDEEFCKICFEDDGCGVSEQQLPRLFERFYRVDKGRSRRMGGTGLGLSIVKHAVQFHGGKISVSNRQNGGLRFEFSLKKRSI